MQKLDHIDRNMNDYTTIVILVLALIASYLLYRKDFKAWGSLDARDKFYALRAPLLIIFVLILFIIKILQHN